MSVPPIQPNLFNVSNTNPNLTYAKLSTIANPYENYKTTTLDEEGMSMNVSVAGVLKNFVMSATGFTDGTNITSLDKLCQFQQILASLEVPPSATTLEVVSSVLVRDTGTNSIALNGVVPSVIISDGTTTTTMGVSTLTSGASSASWADIIAGSAVDTLNTVLIAGNSAGASSINMNTNAITAISTATAKTSLVVDNAVVGANATLTQSNLTINATGLSGLPSLTLNQSGVGSGLLTEEFYNQRTAQTGEFNRMSFYGKNSTGNKTEYARFHQNAPVITSGSTKGRIDLGVNINGSIVDYLTLNGNTNSVGLGANLDCNNHLITEISNASTINGYSLTPQFVNFVSGSGNSTPSGTKDSNMRAVFCNTGVPDSLEAVAGTFPSTWGNITCSITWSSSISGTAFWVGTDTGKLYWTNNNGSSWNIPNSGSNDYTFNNRIRCIMAFNGQLWIGGDFTSESANTFNYICYLDTNEVLQPANWGSIMGSNGVNAPVWTMVENGSYLYFGGAFTTDNTNVLGVNKLASVDAGLTLYDTDGQTTGLNGNGISGNYIHQILINGAYPDNMAICGDINNFNSNTLGFGTITCDNFCVWRFSGNATNAVALYPVFQGSILLNSRSLSVMRNGYAFYVGGNFSNTQEVGTGNNLPYFFNIEYDGSTAWNQVANPYSFVATSPIILQLHLNGLWWADANGALYQGGNLLVNAPFGPTWSWIGDETTGNYFSTNSPSQNPITMYYWNTSDAISIVLSDALVAPNGNTYSGNLVLNALGSTAELIWSGSYWYVLSTQGGVGYN